VATCRFFKRNLAADWCHEEVGAGRVGFGLYHSQTVQSAASMLLQSLHSCNIVVDNCDKVSQICCEVFKLVDFGRQFCFRVQ
jgi:hypothetical protein